MDIDLNYIAHIDRAQRLAERPDIVKAFEQVATGLGYKLQNGTDDHALREWHLGYNNHSGGQDVSQTDGKELPQIAMVQGEPHDYQGRLRTFAGAQGISIEYSCEIAPARGTYSGGCIKLLPGQSPAEEFSTLAHEVAHELLHRGDRRGTTSRRIRETEAEATAFVVCHAIGLETGSAACDYIQLWNGDAQLLTESLAHVRQAASQILTSLSDG